MIALSSVVRETNIGVFFVILRCLCDTFVLPNPSDLKQNNKFKMCVMSVFSDLTITVLYAVLCFQ